MMKYLLVPPYVYSWLSIINVLCAKWTSVCAYISFILQFSFEQWLYVRFPGRSQKKIWVVSFVVSTALVLTPAPLIELRYYTTPFFLLFLHSHINSNTKLQFIGVFYVFVNIFTMFMFLFRPFHWDHEPGIQRFIWEPGNIWKHPWLLSCLT